MNKKLLLYIIFFGLLIAGFWWMVYNFSMTDEQRAKKSNLAIINDSIPTFQFTDQNGKLFSKSNTDGKVYVAEFFFTTCKGICPKMNLNMRRIYDQFKETSDFLIASHTCMPEVDSVPLLKAYERKMITGSIQQNEKNGYKLIPSLDTSASFANKNWFFVTGDKTSLYFIARKGYLIDKSASDNTTPINEQFIHTQFFALVDRNGRVRGIYDGLKEAEIKTLLKDIEDLLKEKYEPSRFLNGFSNSPN
jgi:protein SCO1/2